MQIQGGLPARALAVLSSLWLGGLLTIGLVAAPAAFQVLERPFAAALVARLFAVESTCSLLAGVLAALLERWSFRSAGEMPRLNGPILLALGAVFCTVAGYHALQPLMDAARAGQGRWSFGQLHALSLAFYGLKIVLAAGLAVLSTRALALARRA